MAKFARAGTRPAAHGPITTTGIATTHQGGAGFSRDAKSDLFLLAVSNMVGEDTFYEKATERDARFRDLIHQVALEDFDWLARFGKWLRTEAFMRSASIALAAETVWARLDAERRGVFTQTPQRTNRDVIDSAIQRLDEPAEMLAYWQSRYGRNIPKPVKRGVADATERLLTEYAYMKYDGTGRVWRLGNVIDVVHPKPSEPWRHDLVQYALDRAHHPQEIRASLERLPQIQFRRWLESVPKEERRAWLRSNANIGGALRNAGATWEWLAGWLPGGMDAEAWEAVIPVMGHMALIRNLRNFDEAGISDATAEAVVRRIADPNEVARGMQFPYRYWAAHEASADSWRWGRALSVALSLSTSNIPEFPGRTLVLVDTSASMRDPLSAKSKLSMVDAAATFGAAVAARNKGRVDLIGFATGAFRHEVSPGEALMATVANFSQRVGEVGHGTDVNPALEHFYRGHDRILVFSDEQVGYRANWPTGPQIYVWNLGGYSKASINLSVPGRVGLGGLSDKMFSLIPAIEKGRHADWPF